jgi:uncharacterized membrane protein HdeD (DUF308 family)
MRTWSVVLSVLMIAAGIAAIAAPSFAGVAMTAVVGWLLIVSGLMHAAFAWRSPTSGAMAGEVVLGVLYGAIGLYVITHPVVGLASLTLSLASYLLIEAVVEFVLAFQHRPAAGWLVVDGVVTLALAVLIWSTWPFNSGWVVGTFVGISMLFSGFSRLMLSSLPQPVLR